MHACEDARMDGSNVEGFQTMLRVSCAVPPHLEGKGHGMRHDSLYGALDEVPLSLLHPDSGMPSKHSSTSCAETPNEPEHHRDTPTERERQRW